MTEAIDSWLTPLLFISAPALMILSTAARYAQLHGEIHHRQPRRRVAESAELLPELRQ